MESCAAARATEHSTSLAMEGNEAGQDYEASFAGSTERHVMDHSRTKILVMQLTEWASPYHTG